MNKLNGIIANIQQAGSIMLVDIKVNSHLFSAMLIASDEENSWLKTGNRVDVVFKETEVSLAKGLSGQICLRNRMLCTVKDVTKGELLSKVTMDFMEYTIVSVITTRSVEALTIQPSDEVEAMVKANEVTLMRTTNLNAKTQ
ncbi:MAG: TOBE domain-containing protein [Bacteroidota bacterium]|nr:TOBE domain-containing protein [Bacteroidota bacterium]